jgi:predicted aldo/keto reductase-like oxidoreductase
VDTRLEGGVLEVMLKAQEEGKVRHLGFTGHSNPESHLRMLEKTASSNPFDTCQMPVSVVDENWNSFNRQVTPILQQRQIALLAMKTLADGRFFGTKKMGDRVLWRSDDPTVPGYLSIRDALHYVWSLPVSVLITGAENASLVREKVDFARSFVGLTEADRSALVEKVASLPNKDIEYYKSPVS